MVATTGAQLLPDATVKTLCTDLLPVTYLLTPNIPEADLILRESGHEPPRIHSLEDLKTLAKDIARLGPKYVLVKGGHLPLSTSYKTASAEDDQRIVANILVGKDICEIIELPYRKSKNTHGTGCSLACSTPVTSCTAS